ncbi:hypothetical protein J6590_033598 [Homalodisca vitripennis]|nr:hypothetical protein J6590_033598 [Homalodisca vitripennis]
MRKLDYKAFGTGKEQSGLYIRLTETAREGKCRGRSLSLSLASLPTRQARIRDWYCGNDALEDPQCSASSVEAPDVESWDKSEWLRHSPMRRIPSKSSSHADS